VINDAQNDGGGKWTIQLPQRKWKGKIDQMWLCRSVLLNLASSDSHQLRSDLTTFSNKATSADSRSRVAASCDWKRFRRARQTIK
jgi:hypothetical protein